MTDMMLNMWDIYIYLVIRFPEVKLSNMDSDCEIF